MTVESGRLRHRVTVQGFTEAQSDHGTITKTWSNLGTYWADVRSLMGKEGVVAKQVRADLTHKVVMRDVGIHLSPERHRLIFDGAILNIEEALIDRVGASWELKCIQADV